MGSLFAACGIGGSACIACTPGHICTLGQCISPSGGGAGGGSGGGIGPGTGGGSAIRIGNTTPFSTDASFGASYLLGTRVTLTQSLVLTHFGVLARSSGQSVRFALYTDTGGPASLLASSQLSTMSVGALEIPATAQVTLQPGTYWLMGNYGTGASAGQGGNMVSINYISLPISSPLPTAYGSGTIYTGSEFNYYLVGH